MPDPHDRPGVRLDVGEREVVVAVTGVVDFRQVPALRDRLAEAVRVAAVEGIGLRVDLSGVEHVDSVGIGVLVAAWRRARSGGTDFALRDPSPRTTSILRITRLDLVMPVEPVAEQP